MMFRRDLGEVYKVCCLSCLECPRLRGLPEEYRYQQFLITCLHPISIRPLGSGPVFSHFINWFSPKLVCSTQAQVGPKAEPRNCIQVSHLGNRGTLQLFQRRCARILISAPVWNAGVSSSNLTYLSIRPMLSVERF